MNTRRLRLLFMFLMASLTGLIVYKQPSFTQLLWQPIHCSSAPPSWLAEVSTLSQELGHPGFQLSYVSSAGERLDCAVGWADKSFPPERMRLEHRMRYASLTKVFTSTVAFQLVAEGKLSLEDKLVGLLDLPPPYADNRVAEITLAHLLTHTAGFDRARSPDPMMQAEPWCPTVINTISHVQLDHPPGSRYAYSNLGYCLLGAVIAKIERKSLDTVFAERLFQGANLAGIKAVKQKTLEFDEAKYYFDDAESLDSLTALNYASLLAVGAYSGSAKDLLTILDSSFGKHAKLLPKNQQQLLLSVAQGCDIEKWRGCHGFGFYKHHESGKKTMFWRDGSLPGVTAFSAIFDDGSILVYLANSRPHDWMPHNDRLGKEIYQLLGRSN